ncbi:unnamed protein product, partial [Allacma fusca]
MLTSKILILVTVGITILFACHISQSFKIQESDEGA